MLGKEDRPGASLPENSPVSLRPFIGLLGSIHAIKYALMEKALWIGSPTCPERSILANVPMDNGYSMQSVVVIVDDLAFSAERLAGGFWTRVTGAPNERQKFACLSPFPITPLVEHVL